MTATAARDGTARAAAGAVIERRRPARKRAGAVSLLLEAAAAAIAAVAAAVLASSHLLQGDVVEGDALVHQYWMRSFADPGLFTDGLTASLRRSERYPDGYEELFRLASHIVDPIAFGEWLGVALMATAGLLVFAVVRSHTAWRPAAWIGGALFLALDGHRFYGGFPRGFLHVVVLTTVLLSIRGRPLTAAVVAAAGALFYPPAALLAVGVLVVSALGRRERWPAAAVAVVLGGAAVLLPQLMSGASSEVMTAAQARAFPDFGARGPLRFFVSDPLDYLRQNRSGFDLRASGSVLLLTTLALLAARPSSIRLLRREVLAMPVVSLAGWAAAQAVLFKLYLPHRYTYPLLAFAAIAVGVLLGPTWEKIAARGGGDRAGRLVARSTSLRGRRVVAAAALVLPAAFVAFATVVFPLGPMRPASVLTTPGAVSAASALVVVALAGAALLRTAAAAAVLSGVLLVACVFAAPGRRPPGQTCATTAPVARIAALPKDAVIAGDPADLKCLVVSARRAVVISTQLAPSYERTYFLAGRARMFATLAATYGRDPRAIPELASRFGVTHLWIRRDEIRAGGERWRQGQLPYGAFVRAHAAGAKAASLRLPTACRVWRGGEDELYDVACVGRRFSARAMRTRQRSGSA